MSERASKASAGKAFAATDADSTEHMVAGAGIDFTDPHSPLAPYYLGASQVSAVILLVSIFLYFSLFPPLWHSDFWGHLRYGEWMLDHHALPAEEPFSPYAEKENPYLYFMWLSQSSYAWLFRAGSSLAGGDADRRFAGGVEMIRSWHALLVTLKCLFLLAAFRRIGASMPLACLGLITVLFFSLAPMAVQRPQAYGELCFAILLWTLSGSELSWLAVAGIPIVLALWANLHGSFLMGFGLLAAFSAGRATEGILTRRWPWRDPVLFKQILASLLALLAVGVVNPLGFEIFPTLLSLSKNPNIATMEEWRPLDFTRTEGGHWGYLMMLVLLLVSQAISRRSLGASQMFVILLFGVTPLFQQRLVVWWVMLFPWLLIPLWKEIGERLTRNWGAFQSVLSFRKTLAAIGVVAIGIVWSGPFQLLLGAQPTPVKLSVSQATLLDVAKNLNNAKTPFKGKIFTPEILSDYLIWAVPDAPVLTYSHVHVFPKDHWEDYMVVLFAKPGWWEVLDRHRVNVVIIEPELHTELAEALRNDPRWRILADESENPTKRDRRTRLLFAQRKQPV